MIKKKLFGIIFIIGTLLIAGCGREDDKDMKEIEETASHVASEYMKVEEKMDFIVTSVDFFDGQGVTTVAVNGHEKGKKKELAVIIDYGDNYRVQGTAEN
ncbi:hypothetical protein [Priestia aryabhattai]|uniref:hypothetical protein n=1 Tax=Priestia aryabhattai TaxID=412384 RepID=UPI001C8D080E|nr:hypothetical protein [Priestia aryabhattai]MBY0062070.1 hypothetical protein [Priestia aryabhattai]